MEKIKHLFGFCILVLLINPLYAQNLDRFTIPSEFYSHPEYGQVKLNGDPSTLELIHLRTEKSRTFKSADGKYHVQQTGGCFHYKNAQNQWISIQEEISGHSSDPRIYGIFQSEMPISVDTRN